MLHVVRRLVGRLNRQDDSRFQRFTEHYGCLRAAASHVTWSEVPGDYLEFGVWRGGGVIEAYHALQYYALARRAMLGGSGTNMERRLLAFDSFEGLPRSELDNPEDYAAGSYMCTEREFRANLGKARVPEHATIVVKGEFTTSLTPDVKKQHGLSKAAIVYIDCDLYESTVPVLEFVSDLVVQGSILIFDDWFRFAGSRRHGERRACQEWLSKARNIELEDWWQEGPQCKAFLVHRLE